MTATRVPPGPRGLLLIGNALQAWRDPFGFLERCARDHGDVVRVRFGTLVAYMVNHPRDIEYVLRTNHRNFIKDKGTRMLTTMLGEGLLTSEGDLWRRQRRLAQPAFQLDQIQRYGEVMVSSTLRMLEGWRPGQTRDVHQDMMRLTLEVVGRTLFGTGVDAAVAEQVDRAMKVVMEHYASPLMWYDWAQRLPTPGNLRFRRAVRQLRGLMSALIRRRRESDEDPGDLLSRLLAARDEDGSRMTDRQLMDELATLLLAGHETTALALSYTFYLLSQHPEVDARLAAELEEVLGGRAPTAADVSRLRYTEWVIKESMRLYPPAYGIGREALADCEIGGYLLPKGAQLSLLQWIVHRDPRWFDEPLTFRPDRWDNDLAKRLPRCAYFPFGDGPRICIGNHFAMMEAVLILAAVARRFRLVLVPGQTLELLPSITLRPRRGIRMTVHERRGQT
jgi:cytochrome P450